MFETLTKGFRTAKQRFQGLAELDEATVDEALKDVRTALLEADVGFDVVQDFCKRVKEKAVGVIVKVKASTKEKVRRVSPEDHFVKLCHDELVDLMGPVDTTHQVRQEGRRPGSCWSACRGRARRPPSASWPASWRSSTSARCWWRPTSTAPPRSIS